VGSFGKSPDYPAGQIAALVGIVFSFFDSSLGSFGKSWNAAQRLRGDCPIQELTRKTGEGTGLSSAGYENTGVLARLASYPPSAPTGE